MKYLLAIGIAGAIFHFAFRADPVENEIRRSSEVSQAVDAPEQVARTNYLKSPIDRTRAVVDQVNSGRSDSDF